MNSNYDWTRDYQGLITAPSVLESGGTLLNLLAGGLVLPTTPKGNRLSFVGQLVSAEAKDVFRDPSKVTCTVNLPTKLTPSLVDSANGSPVILTTSTGQVFNIN